MANHYALVTDVASWFETCLPGPPVPQDILDDADATNIFRDVPKSKREDDYYPVLYEAFRKLLDGSGGKYFMPFTGHNPEENSNVSSADTRPDFCMYEKDGPGVDTFTIKTSPPKDNSNSAGQATTANGSDAGAEVQHETQTGSPMPTDTKNRPATDAKDKDISDPHQKTKALQARVAWPWITAFIEVKHDPLCLAYDVKKGSFIIPNTDDAKKTRSQIIKYVAEISLRQHRQFVLCALIIRERAFLMRWDRAGAIVAEPFDYVANPELLLRFLYRIAVAERPAQGYDPTATLASPDEIEQFKAYRDTYALKAKTQGQVTLLRYMDDILSPGNQRLHPIYKLICPDPDPFTALEPDQVAKESEGIAKAPASIHAATQTGLSQAANEAEDPAKDSNPRPEKTHAFLVGLPRHGTRSPTGRGGKGFVAYDLDRGRCSFLKDYWYPLSPSVHPETEVYKKLNANNVRYVATLLAGGDVGCPSALQETLTQEYLPEKQRPAVRRHHRFVVAEIGRPLETYDTGIELYDIVSCALRAHKDAWEMVHILHRDVSMGNILINVETDEGFLNDWDLCKYKDDLNKPASQHARSGTWPYMSAALLRFPRKPNEVADDLESFVYVISLAILRFHVHNLTQSGPSGNDALGIYVTGLYHAAQKTTDGYWIGGHDKLNRICTGNPGFSLVDETSNLSVLLERLWFLSQNHYANLNMADMEVRWGVGRVVEEPRDPAELGGGTASPFNRRQAVNRFEDDLDPPKDIPPLDFPKKSSRTPHPELGDFSSHAGIIGVFRSVRSGWYTIQDNTKTEDQFVGMVAYGPTHPARSIGGVRQSSRAVNSTDAGSVSKGVKRSSQAMGRSEVGSMSKRVRM
ncbi:hypothetical protein PHLGIDRAFT_96169 [Phlebiopsis gigantea 11061_1 CR5-6]|uniref:Fungal-type protein kinase domain-containing protein n=1 Tax=Phlebiopsis gigantea (strain 11061_1 CR5-6) TaxID=745531 RepID=A0A0C3PBG0_PHLG1|nr:hypothetical protein PHLGIDRAFT_96169 [Phlebiopsis gigantea 11061_1 CR5-6]